MVKQRTSKFQDGRGTIPEEPAMSRSLHIWKEVSRALVLPILAAAYSRVSLLALAPVYGSTPSRVWHDVLCNTAILAGSFSPESLRKIENILPGLALSIPVFQSFLFQRSSLFGNPTGPVLTELMTIFPFLLFSTSSYLKRIERLNLGQRHPLLTGCIFALYGVLAFRLADTAIQSLLPAYIGSTVWMTTFATRVNSTLHGVGYSLVDRQESLTGYISVLDNVELGFRAMRCDHSLLGGEWTHRPSHYNPRVSDPIYAVFTMLEAVRLVESDPELPKKEDKDRNALVIGLGIGTTPAALIQHGIETTIVEIDPVVYRFAVQHFHFPPNHTAVIDNAISFVETARHESKKYDYIIHDVFTGGVEPIELFTLEFIQGLEALLAEDGVVAINYAGDISLPGAGVVIRTIKAVFPECRIFRENDGSELPAEESFDFINMVVFCKKNRTSPLTFRLPNEEDYLGSQARKSYMYPRREIDSRIFDIGDDSTDQRILEVGNTSILEASHIPNAIGHWNIMRDVLPAKVWENF
uniref:Spermidine synthase n=1 Tax=Talaromyces marneffei PM1 TaxID=1077442 RepID=A0A093UU72_TALMA